MVFINLLIRLISKVSAFITFLFDYKTIYKLTGIFFTRKFRPAKHRHKYAILVAARNEEAVIGNLIDSIKQQDYPQRLIDIFVVADNCTDSTAEIAAEKGAHCYRRFDNEHRTKGYALQFLVERIRRDYGIEKFDGYLIFDADNLLKKDYISRMNDSFDAGEKIITSYRNSKNFDDNWIAASYGVHWLRTVRNEHRARSVFHLATRIQGTGFLFANELIRDGWNYTSLTEDRAFCADAVANGYRISYNDAAEFYDEQPVDIKIAMRQRIRWAKGHLQAFAETGPKLLKHVFTTKDTAELTNSARLPIFKRLFNNIRLRFMSFDMFSVVYPRQLITIVKKLVVYSLRATLIIDAGAVFGLNYAPDSIEKILKFFNIYHEPQTQVSALLWLAFFTFSWTIVSYCKQIITAAYVYIIERKRIKPIKWYKKIWFCLTFPIFDLIGKISMCIALFTKAEWKSIPHTSSVKISDLS